MLALTVQKKGIGGASKAGVPALDTARFRTRRNPPHRKVFSKWQDSPDEVEAHGRTAGVPVLALEGP